MVRILFWTALVIIWIAFCNIALIFVLSQRPDPGRMILMGAGCFYPPMLFAVVFVIGLILVDGGSFNRWEHRLGWLAVALTLAIWLVGSFVIG